MAFPLCVMTISSPAAIHPRRLVYRFLKSLTVAVFMMLHYWSTRPSCQADRSADRSAGDGPDALNAWYHSVMLK